MNQESSNSEALGAGISTEIARQLGPILETLQAQLHAAEAGIQASQRADLQAMQDAIVQEMRLLGKEKESPFTGKVVAVEFLRTRATALLAYLKQVHDIVQQAHHDHERLQRRDYGAAVLMGQSLLKFHRNPTTFEATWGGCLTEISATGLTVQPDLVKLFLRMDNARYDDNQREREFQKLLNLQGLFDRHLSSIFVLVEELRNFGRIAQQTADEEAFKTTYSAHLATLQSICRTLQIQPLYVPLFTDYSKSTTPLKLAAADYPSEPNAKVIGLTKDSIIEVVSYGFKSDLGESDTLIIKV